jgi:Tfp pilus assembly protein PilV
MAGYKGFTLIETLITTLVLVTGLAAVAGLFSYAAQTNAQNRQRTAATALLNSKMEEIRSERALTTGQFTEHVSIEPDGSVYRRISIVEPGTPQRVTVILYARQSNRGGAYQELARATVLLGRRF